jgi:subtilisin-like proprotein convertase family protein
MSFTHIVRRLPRRALSLSVIAVVWIALSVVLPANAAAYAFINTLSISVPTQGAANPYPSLINVTGATGIITDIDITLNSINHYFPDDLDIVVRSPSGAAVMLMSDSCGGNLMLGVNLRFDDEAGGFLSDTGSCFSASYKPTNFTDTPNTLPPPAPNTYSNVMSAFDGTNPNGAWELFVFDDTLSSTNAGAIASGWRIDLTTTISIPQLGTALPYPSQKTFTGITGSISDIDVRLTGLSHGFPDDLDLLLQSPDGVAVMLMSDACGGTPVNNLNLTFSDEAANALPNGTACGSGSVTYRPGNYLDEGAENLPSPAPLGPYWGALSAFDGGNPNGTWKLFIRDDSNPTGGSLSDWDLTINTTPTPPNLLQNGNFNSATIGDGNGNWGVAGQIVHRFNSGVFEFYRNGASAVVLQRTGAAIPANGAIHASFQLGNSSSVRKRASVLITDSDFSDIAFCTFWIPPGAPLRTYRITTHTTEAWTNAMFSLYASNDDGAPWLRFDNASMQYFSAFIHAETLCVDPLTPPTTGTTSSANLIANPSFSTTPIAPWTPFWNIQWQVAGGVFEFTSTGDPAGLIEQNTPTSTAIGTPLEATFQLGNASAQRRRVTVLLRKDDYTDLQACTFWLPPNSTTQTYMMRTWAPSAWNETSITFFASTTAAGALTRLDNVVLRQRLDLNVHGTECYTPGSLVDNSTEWMFGAGMGEADALQPTLMPTATMQAAPPYLAPGLMPELPLLATPVPPSESTTGEGTITE